MAANYNEQVSLEGEKVKEAWEKEWKEMPEFDQKDFPCYRRLVVAFRNEKDFKEFVLLMKQRITDGQRSIWYPYMANNCYTNRRWMDEDESP
jgi:hypothetical protein